MNKRKKNNKLKMRCIDFISTFLLAFTLLNIVLANLANPVSFFNTKVSPSDREEAIEMSAENIQLNALEYFLGRTEILWDNKVSIDKNDKNAINNNYEGYWNKDALNILKNYKDINEVYLKNLFSEGYFRDYNQSIYMDFKDFTYGDKKVVLENMKKEQVNVIEKLKKETYTFGNSVKEFIFEANNLNNLIKISGIFLILAYSLFMSCPVPSINKNYIIFNFLFTILSPFIIVGIKYYNLIDKFMKLNIQFIPCLMIIGMLTGIIIILTCSKKEGK